MLTRNFSESMTAKSTLAYLGCGMVGIDVKLGDEMNGYEAEANLKTVAEIVPWLQQAIHKHYPTSTYNLDRLMALPNRIVEFPAATDGTTS